MGKWKGKQVGVLMGGWSREREVSLRSGKAVAEALRRTGHTVVEIDVQMSDDQPHGGVEGGATRALPVGGASSGFAAVRSKTEGFAESTTRAPVINIVSRLLQQPPDVLFIALHGKFGEDGVLQGLLESLRIPYTGSGVLASAVAMDKVVCKQVARTLEIPTPDEQIFSATTEQVSHFLERLTMNFPCIVKPAREGSTVGMTVVTRAEALGAALQLAAGSDTKILVEEYVTGKEITVGVVTGQVLPAVEIVPKSGFYDYVAKYTKGMTEYLCPARIDETTAQLTAEWTLRLWHALECRGFARADFIVRPDGSAVFLELNTIPGMTETSLIPKAAAAAGMHFDTVCERILDDASLKGGV